MASGSHLTQFNGTGLQTISMPDTSLSFFQDLSLANSVGGIDVQTLLQVRGNLDVVAGTTVNAPNTGPFFPGFNVLNNVTFQGGTSVSASRLFVGGALNATGTYDVFQTIFTGSGQTAPSGLAYQQLWTYGTVTMAPGPLAVTDLVVSLPASSLTLSGPTSVSGNISLGNLGGGNLKLNGQQVIVAGALTVDQAATLTMQLPTDSLVVGGDASFKGASEVGLLTDGFLQIGGNFDQASTNSPTSFAASGRHLTLLGAATARSVNFASPGSGAAGSHFNALNLSDATGGLTMNSDVVVDSALVDTASASLLNANGKKFTAKQFQVTGLVVDNGQMVLNEQGTARAQQFDNVTFQNNTTSTMLDVTAVGAALAPRTIQFNNTTVPFGGTNLYVQLTSSNGLGVTVVMNGSNNPTGGPSRSNPPFGTTVGGARILWQ